MQYIPVSASAGGPCFGGMALTTPKRRQPWVRSRLLTSMLKSRKATWLSPTIAQLRLTPPLGAAIP